ncbi:MAG: FHA domain-containing protein [Dehalococcoidia bacterium]|nr:FHA domain-containing protein [Dehalococcoidia bacterium]
MSEEFIVSVTLPGTPEHFTRACSGSIRIGRSPDADLQLVHPLVSRQHAEVAMHDDGTFVVADLGSSNGTVVNDQMLNDASREISGEASLQIGPYVLRLAPGSVIQEDTFLSNISRNPSGRVALDSGMRVLLVDGQPAVEGLTGLEYRLMEALTAAQPRLVPNQAIGDAVWGSGLWDTYMLHNLVRRVRRKLEAKNLPADELIVSVPGGGYRVT